MFCLLRKQSGYSQKNIQLQFYIQKTMSERKVKRDTTAKPSSSKPSSTKHKAFLLPKQEKQLVTISKNLLQEFNAAELHHRSRPEQSYEAQLSQKESEPFSSAQEESKLEQSDQSHFERSDFGDEPPTDIKRPQAQIAEYAELQLPKSYILAMRGLQEAVEQREKETRKMKKVLAQQAALCQRCNKQKEEEMKAKNALQARLNECILENKFYRDTVLQTKQQAAEQLRLKTELERKLAAAQETILKSKTQNDQLQRRIQSNIHEKDVLREELKTATKKIDQKKNDYNELLLKRSEEYSQNYTEVISLRQEAARLKEQHDKDSTQISVLREQVAILSEKLLFQEARAKEKDLLEERKHLDRLQRQIQVNRQVLQEVNFDQNAHRQSFSRSHFNSNLITETKAPVQPAPTPIKQLHSPQQSSRLEDRSKHERSSTMRHDRSTSRMRQANEYQYQQHPPQRRELIGQMRELMRHQKELISLNYQMEVLQRGILEGPPNRKEEAQQAYGKLKRNIEKKEAEVRELKHLIDRATTAPTK